MLTHKTEIRVRYADTDQMQFVYNGKYLEYFEVARTEMLRHNGLQYKLIEDKGYMLPLLEANVKFNLPAYYDDILTLEASVKEIPTLVIHIDYEITRNNGIEIVAQGFTKHVFVNKELKRAVRPPEFFNEAIKPYFNK
jgi:acyl-CoA thioester hydrolase